MDRSATTKEIDKALLEFQRRVEPVTKDARNPHFKNTYPTIKAMLETVLPLATELGLVILQPVAWGGDDRNTLQLVVKHVESSEFYEYDMLLTPADKTPQGMKAAITYGRRTMLESFLGLAAEDDDGNEASGRGTVTQTVAFNRTEERPLVKANRDDETMGKPWGKTK